MVDLRPAVKLIKSFEGIMDGDPRTVNLDPYLCPAGYWTIGWGHVVLSPSGEMLKGSKKRAEAYAIYPAGITLQAAENLLAEDVQKFSKGVAGRVKTVISNNQFCALVSFAYNVGLGAFGASTLLKKVNRQELQQVPDEFRKWVNGGGRRLPGLVRRREAEVKLWLLP